jgi:hypothetical protein
MENLALLKWGTEQCKNTSGSDTIRQATTVDAAHGSVASCSLSLAGAQEKERVGRRARAGTRARACTRARTRRHTCTKTRGQRQSTRAAAQGDPTAPQGAGQTCRLRRPGQPSAHHRAPSKRASSRTPDSSVPRPSLSPVCLCSRTRLSSSCMGGFHVQRSDFKRIIKDYRIADITFVPVRNTEIVCRFMTLC